MFASWSLPALIALFAVGAIAVWRAGVPLSYTTDILSSRLGLGEELGGQILLAFATNLPEIAIVVAASFSGAVALATGNILGGIAAQTLVLVLLDAVAVHERPLTFAGAALTLVLEGISVVAMLIIAVMGMTLRPLVFLRMTPVGIALVLCWLASLWVVGRARKGLPWHGSGVPSDRAAARKDVDKREEAEKKEASKRSLPAVSAMFAAAAAVTLAGGVMLEQTSEVIAQRVGMSGPLFGATILAGVTALPEVSTGLAAIGLGDYRLALSDIFGGNAFLPVLLPLAVLLSGKDPLAAGAFSNTYVSALGILMTVVYVGGIVFRPRREFLRLGPDSWAVLGIYLVGIAGLALVR